jgi:hypothetical protein
LHKGIEKVILEIFYRTKAYLLCKSLHWHCTPNWFISGGEHPTRAEEDARWEINGKPWLVKTGSMNWPNVPIFQYIVAMHNCL